ncbi:MAG: gamma-glutamylcyclotransferase [Hyphomicrobiaceae bacterium]
MHHRAPKPLWIFAYGSLMWRPDFPYEESVRARVEGWRRGFFIYSTHHRGDAARPGLVLALDRGGACEGLAYRVADREARATLEYLRAREQVNGVYREAGMIAQIEDGSGRLVPAIAYVAERNHPSFAGTLPLAEQARLIRAACGISGPNLAYLVSTLHHLEQLGMRERNLWRLLSLAAPHLARKTDAAALHRASRSLMRACSCHRPIAPRMPQMQRRRFIYRKQIAQWALADGEQ